MTVNSASLILMFLHELFLVLGKIKFVAQLKLFFFSLFVHFILIFSLNDSFSDLFESILNIEDLAQIEIHRLTLSDAPLELILFLQSFLLLVLNNL